MACDPGVAGSFAVGESNPITPGASGRILDILSESIAASTSFLDGNGIKGIRSRYSARTALGPIDVGGSFSLHPVTGDLAYLLPKILGANASGTTFAVADSLQSFVIQKKTGASGNRVLTYPTNYISSATFSATRGQLLQLDCNVVGLSESVGSSFPSFTLDTTTTPFVFNDLALSVGGVTYSCFDFSLTVDNAVQVQAVNSRTVTAAYATDRIVTLNHSIPAADILTTTLADNTSAVTATFTYAAQSLSFVLPAVRYVVNSPVLSGRGEVVFPLSGTAYRTASAAEIEVTLDSSP